MLINQFNTDPTLMDLMNKHMAWHGMTGLGFPARSIPQGSPGSGLEFLTFHGQFLNDFFNWNASHGSPIASSVLIPWTSVPAILKTSALGWNATKQASENRINSNSPVFANADALGIEIESKIHNWIHGAVGSSSLPMDAGEPSVIASLGSPQSSYFYNIHGWVNYWWHHWFPAKSILKDSIKEHKEFHKEFIKEKEFHKELIKEKEFHKELIKEHKEFIKEHKEFILDGVKPIKEKDKDKDLIETQKGPADVINPQIPQGDPAISQLHERIAVLEKAAGIKGTAFIKPKERPAVGKRKPGTKG